MATKIRTWNMKQKGDTRHAYASGIAAALLGPATNPYPRGTAKHVAWANGYRQGRGR